MARINAMDRKYELITLFHHPMLFTCLRVDDTTVPKGLYMYEVRHGDNMDGNPIQIAKWVVVNHWGTIITDKPIDLEKNAWNDNYCKDIDAENDWNYESYSLTIDEYMKERGVK